MQNQTIIPPISEALVRKLAERISFEQVEPANVAAPAYRNGITSEVRAFLKNEGSVTKRINETLSVFSR